MAGALAKGLGMAPERVAQVLYRTPAVLMDNVEPTLAESLVRLLQDAGIEARLEDTGEPPPPPPALFDIALSPLDVTRLPEIADRLAEFLGTRPQQALELLLMPPGLVLGQVSAVTADLLASELHGLPVQVLRSQRIGARYCLADTGLSGDLRQRLLRACPAPARDVAGLLATDLSAETAATLVREHAAGVHLPIIDQAFARFEIELLAAPESDAAAGQLAALSDVPERVAPRVLQALPVVVQDNVSWSELVSRLDALARQGFGARGRLTTLDRFRLRRIQAPADVDLPGLLGKLGLCDAASVPPAGPVDVREAYPALQAELLTRSLRSAGCAVELQREVA